ncbi:DUF222 domain-containing protein, partial [Microbacterium azadirachtae]|uniref:DUF222 domain-containing protein n=2 Tax=Microbacterium azadirachtae TaxID=582680 RepID=UPI00111421E3
MTSSMAMADPGVDPARLLDAVVSGLGATEASIVRLQAVKEGFLAVAHRIADDLAGSLEHGPSAELAHRSVAAELAAVLHMSDRVVQGRMSQAAQLVHRFPETMRAFAEARIGLPHVRQIQDAGARLSDADRAEFEKVAVAASE